MATRFAACLCPLILCLSLLSPTFADQKAGQRVPAGTSAGQYLVWSLTANAGFGGWVPYTSLLQADMTGLASGQVSVGGSPDPGSRLSVNPTGAGENGLSVTMPSSSTGYILQGYGTGGVLRTVLTPNGTQTWNVRGGGGEDGAIVYGTPNDYTGIIFYTGSSYNLNRFNIANAGSTFRFYYQSDSSFGAIGLTIAAGGRVGINNTSPASALDVTTPSSSTVGRIIRLASGQTADAEQVLSSTNAKLWSVDKTGAPGAVGGLTPYTGTIPPSNTGIHVRGGIVVGYTAADGSTVGN